MEEKTERSGRKPWRAAPRVGARYDAQMLYVRRNQGHHRVLSDEQRKVGVNPRCKACAAKRARTRYYQPGSREHDRELSRLRQEWGGRGRLFRCL